MDRRSPSLDSCSSEHVFEEIESTEEENERKDLEEKLLELRKENMDQTVLKKCIYSVQVRKALSKILSSYLQETNRNKSRRRHGNVKIIMQLLCKKDSLSADIHSVCEDNRNLEEQIWQKKLELKGLVKERSIYWDEADTAYSLSLRKVKNLKPIDWKLTYSEHNPSRYFENKFQIFSMTNRHHSLSISHLSLILHNLICFSGKPWAHDEKLSQIVQSTGKVLGMNFGAESGEDERKALEIFIHTLNNVTL